MRGERETPPRLARASLLVLAAAGPVLLLSFLLDAAALWAAALVSALLPVALLVLSAGPPLPSAGEGPGVRASRSGWQERLALAAVTLALAGGWVVLFSFHNGGGPSLPWAFGLPLGTAVMLFVMVPVPYVALAWASARSPRRGLTAEDLAQLRELAARRSGEAA